VAPMNIMKPKSARILKIYSPVEGQSLPTTLYAAPTEKEKGKLLLSFPGKNKKNHAFSSSEKAEEIVVSPAQALPLGWYVSNGKEDACWGRISFSSSEKCEITSFAETSLEVSASLRFFPPLKGGVITVSDKGSRGERKDTSGPALVSFFQRIGVDVTHYTIVPDEKDKIQETLRNWIKGNQCHIIVLTGGSGISPRDVTPDALLEMGEKVIPGFGEFMRLSSAVKNPKAILSRGGGVLFEKCIILSVPGSRRGALECVQAVAPALRHAVEIAQGWGGECGHEHHR